jgi:hypothetical protein
VTREKNKAEKAEREFEENYPLLKLGGLSADDVKKGRGR